MVTAEQLAVQLKKVHDEESFIQHLLVNGLGWAIDEDVDEFESITYDWTEEDLHAAGLERRLVEGRIRQIQPLAMSQPWGIFLLEFKHGEVFHKGRGMVGLLRQVLRGLIPRKRREAHLAAWKSEDILFICTHKWEHYSFVHFAAPRDGAKLTRLTSFGWGPETQGRTVTKFNLPALEWPERSDDPDAWRKAWLAAFDKEALTKNFFKTFQGLYQRVRDDIAADKKQAGAADQKALILLNRLIFLYFIQKKGWLAGKPDFLARAFDLGHRNQTTKSTFYREFLFPLFQRLSMPDCLDQRFKDVPFLNGGLFEIDNTQADGDLKVKSATFAALFDELLEHYNFTASEDTPLDVEVAIDPEMLGKIFEELVTGRHESGAYYTPRAIVSFMCREALKGYLGNGNAVEPFVDGHDASKLENPEAILEKLKAIRVCDPACGSGAYLVGMMQELMALRQELFQSKKVGSKDAYQRKLEIIRNNLYGVDLDPVAIHIARLRLWLSLVIEYDGPDPDPLPNLDFKIEQGDSVTGPDPSDGMRDLDLFAYDLINEFEQKKKIYLSQNVYGDKAQLKAELQNLRRQLCQLMHHQEKAAGFDWALEFAEVFGDKRGPGFDVVLANPPYVRHELIKDQKPALKKVYPEVYTGTADLFCYFYARALQMLRPGGMLVFISSNKWYRAGYGEKLRALLARELTIRQIIDFGDAPIFEAIAYASILVGERAAPAEDASAQAYTWEAGQPIDHIAQIVPERGQQIRQSELKPDGWRLESPAVLRLLEKLRRAGKPLGDYVNGRWYWGIKTGLNEAFVVDRATRDRLIHEHKSSVGILKPILRGRDVKRWRTEFDEQYLIKIESSENQTHPWSGKSEREAEKTFAEAYPAIYKWFKEFRPALKKRSDQGKYFWELRSCAYWDEFEKPKLVVPAISGIVNVSLDRDKYISNNKTSIYVSDDAPFLSAVINSKVAFWFTRQVFATKQGGFYDFEPRYSSQWPIPGASSAQQKPLERLVERILSAKQRDTGADVSALEREIDILVYALYGLTPEEIKLVESTGRGEALSTNPSLNLKRPLKDKSQPSPPPRQPEPEKDPEDEFMEAVEKHGLITADDLVKAVREHIRQKEKP